MAAVVVILGMHRSGTSCLTQMLGRCGLCLGDDVPAADESGQPSNLAGCFEARAAVDINDEILAASDGAWNRPPAQLHITSQTRERMQSFVRSLEAFPVAGWKDPRTVLTFPVWQPLLEGYRVIACLRHPLSVARSLEIRDGMAIEEGLNLWLEYNQRLLEIADQEADVLWFDFDQPATWMDAWLQRACSQLGLAKHHGASDAFLELERHQKSTDLPAGPIRAVYQDLWYRAHLAGVRQGAVLPQPNESASAAPADPLHSSVAGLERRVAQLVEVLNKQNIVAQRQQREMQSLRERIDIDYTRMIRALSDRMTTTVHEHVDRLSEQIASMNQATEHLATDNQWLRDFSTAVLQRKPWHLRVRRFVGRQLQRIRHTQ